LVLHRGIHCTLLVVHPYESEVVYLDSGSANCKDYTEIKGVLDKAFNGFITKADHPIKKQKKYEDASPSSTEPSSAATSRLSQIVGWRSSTPSYI
jgi:hypothetical protein